MQLWKGTDLHSLKGVLVSDDARRALSTLKWDVVLLLRLTI